jgi:predicted DNA-binding protein (MmcQ/YjbR family)
MDIESIRSVCLSFPAVTEDVKWENNLCFCIGGKIFCIANLNPPHTFSFKVGDDEFDQLSCSEGFIPAPYLARAKWVMVNNPSRLQKKQLTVFLRRSYELIKAKLNAKTRLALGLD